MARTLRRSQNNSWEPRLHERVDTSSRGVINTKMIVLSHLRTNTVPVILRACKKQSDTNLHVVCLAVLLSSVR